MNVGLLFFCVFTGLACVGGAVYFFLQVSNAQQRYMEVFREKMPRPLSSSNGKLAILFTAAALALAIGACFCF